MKQYVVISLFNGMGCIFQALDRVGIKCSQKISSEIDKYANIVNDANYPETIQMGSVCDINVIKDENGKAIKLISKINEVDLLNDEIIFGGGSPCQSFSFAGRRKGMSTKDEQEILSLEHYLKLKEEEFEFEGQSYLFWEYMRLLNEIKPKYFLLENVEMGEKWEKVLSKAIGVNGIHINSALVSAQNRERIYWFGQIRERIFFNDNFCYVCSHERENKRVQRKSQNQREAEILGKTQGRQGYLQNLRSGIYEDKQEGNNENLFNNLSIKSEKTERQESESRKKEINTQGIFREEQGKVVAVSERLQKDTERQRDSEKSGRKSNKENIKINEESFTQRIDWSKEEANKRAVDYHTKYGKEMCCVQCGKKLDHRPHSSIIERWDKSNYKSSSALSEMQFNEARQKHERVFDILEICIKGIDSLFGETIINIPQPKDKKILLKHILEKDVDKKYFLSDKMIEFLKSHTRFNKYTTESIDSNNKSSCINSRIHKMGNADTYIRMESINEKSFSIRRLTPLECMRLQTVNDDYKMPVSDTQKYKMLGNGWTIDVISYIFSYIK
jgi:site-specific DNA-cytosine methylase